MMMPFWGKVIGAFCGFLIAGPLGMLFGVLIGHFFDRGLHRPWQGWSFTSSQQTQTKQAFFNATFLVMGYLAKSDGRVSPAEIQVARAVMERMGLDETHRQRAIALFEQGKQADFNVDQTLAELMQACHNNRVLLRLFVEFQLQTAMADGPLSQAKQAVLQKIFRFLGFAPLNFAFFEHIFGAQAHNQQQYQQYRYQQGSARAPFTQQQSLAEAYQLLGINEQANAVEIKRAYRRLMSQHHPDKLVSKGLPEEMIKLATEKTQKIKAAYEQICAARGI